MQPVILLCPLGAKDFDMRMDSQLFALIREKSLTASCFETQWHRLRTFFLAPNTDALLSGAEQATLDYLRPHLEAMPAKFRLMPWKVLRKLIKRDTSAFSAGEWMLMKLSLHVKISHSISEPELQHLLDALPDLDVKILDLNDAHPSQASCELLCGNKVFPSLTELKIQGETYSEFDLPPLHNSKSFPSLTHLEAPARQATLDSIAAASTTSLAKLRSLKLRHAQTSSSFFQNALFPDLEYLAVRVNLDAQLCDVFPQSDFCPQLKSLEIAVYGGQSDRVEAFFSSKNFTSLTSLVIQLFCSNELNPDFFRALGRSLPPTLVKLGIATGRRLDDECLEAFSEGAIFPQLEAFSESTVFSQLEKLHLPCAGIEGTNEGRHIRNFFQSGKFPALKSLDLSDNGIKSEGLEALFSAPELANLTSLNVRCSEATIETIDTLLKSHPGFEQLKTFCIGYGALSPEAGTMLLESTLVEHLEALSIQRNTLGDIPFITRAKNPARIPFKTLILSGTALTDAGLEALGKILVGEALVSIDLSECSFTAQGLIAFFKDNSFPQLQSLSFESCGLDDEAIGAFVEHAKLGQLKELNLARNPIGPKGSALLATASELWTLQSLLLNNSSIGTEGLSYLLQHSDLPSLTSLFVQTIGLDESVVDVFSGRTTLFQLHTLNAQQYDNNLGPDGFRAFIENPSYFHLHKAMLSSNRLSDAEINELREIPSSIPHLGIFTKMY